MNLICEINEAADLQIELFAVTLSQWTVFSSCHRVESHIERVHGPPWRKNMRLAVSVRLVDRLVDSLVGTLNLKSSLILKLFSKKILSLLNALALPGHANGASYHSAAEQRFNTVPRCQRRLFLSFFFFFFRGSKQACISQAVGHMIIQIRDQCELLITGTTIVYWPDA
jgi:hypothetical protein